MFNLGEGKQPEWKNQGEPVLKCTVLVSKINCQCEHWYSPKHNCSRLFISCSYRCFWYSILYKLKYSGKSQHLYEVILCCILDGAVFHIFSLIDGQDSPKWVMISYNIEKLDPSIYRTCWRNKPLKIHTRFAYIVDFQDRDCKLKN